MSTKAAPAPLHADAQALRARRDELVEAVLAGQLAPLELTSELAAAADAFLTQLLDEATGHRPQGYALIAVGGYGRSELSPGSDLDLVLVHRHRRHWHEVAERCWYAIWDSGFRLDHSVRTKSEVAEMARRDMKVALGFLDARHVAGDEALSSRVIGLAHEYWRREGTQHLAALAQSISERHRSFGELAFLLEPDLKQSAGGLRDVGALRALAHALPFLAPLARSSALQAAEELITNVRVVVHCCSGTATDRLALQEQDEVADVLHFRDADALMAAMAEAGRTIAAASAEAWRRARPSYVREALPYPPTDVPLAPGIVLRAGEVAIDH